MESTSVSATDGHQITLPQAEPAMPAALTSFASLDLMPAEILCDIYGNLDLPSALSLRQTSRILEKVFQANKIAILLPILRRDFDPIDGLFNLLAAKQKDVYDPERCPDWVNGRAIFLENWLVVDQVPAFPSVHLSGDDLRRLYRLCKTIMDWEAAFPQLRFALRPALTRQMGSAERWRLRKSLYTWWRYCIYYHGSFFGPYVEQDHGDVRLNLLRTLSTSELFELKDLWDTLRHAVATHICPSTSKVRTCGGPALGDDEIARLSWGSGLENDRIVSTVMRLDPTDILYYLQHRYRFSRASLSRNILEKKPTIAVEIESLTYSIHRVIRQRLDFIALRHGRRAVAKRKKFFPFQSFPNAEGGILDWKPPRWEKARAKYSRDGGLRLEYRDLYPGVLDRGDGMAVGQLVPRAGEREMRWPHD